MKADDFWKLFTETGEVVYYLLYKEEQRKEESDAVKAG